MPKILTMLTMLAILSSCDSEVEEVVDRTNSFQKDFSKSQKRRLVIYADFEFLYPDNRIRTLASAASHGDIDGIYKAIQDGANVQYKGNLGATPLFWVWRQNSIEGFDELLKLGADPNVVFEDGSTIIHWSMSSRESKFLKSLLEYGGDPNLIGRYLKQTPVFEAITFDREVFHEEKLRMLVDKGAELEIENELGHSPLQLAILFRRADIVSLLLELGAVCGSEELVLAKKTRNWFPSNKIWEKARAKCQQNIQH